MKRRTVLFVDDERNVLASLQRGLRNEPYNKLFAESGQKALEILEKNKVHVIVSDMRMPGMDGLTFLRKVKEKYPDIVRIVLTGYTQINQIIAAINSGEIFRYITKPWKMDDEFKTVIRQAIEYYNLQEGRRELLEKLTQSNQELKNRIQERVLQIKTNFLNNISCEVKAPLTGIIGYSNLLLNSQLDEKQKEYVSHILKLSKRLLVFFSNVLELPVVKTEGPP